MISDDAFDLPNPTSAEEARTGFVVRGHVQGVGFRWWTREIAADLRLRGTVRNLADGGVEIHVAGPAAAVAAFLESVRRGPSRARVDRLEEIPSLGTLPEGFHIAF